MEILNYKSYGEGEPLLILHGLFGSLDNWQTLAKKWSDSYKVITIDLPNHGKSFHTNEFSYDQMAKAVADLCDHLNLTKVNLLGHSMGGKTAINFAVNFPDLLNKLIVVDIAPKAYAPHHDEILDGLHYLKPNEIKTRKEADEKLSNKIDNAGIRMFLLKNLKRMDIGYAWKMNLPLLTKAINNVIEDTAIPHPINTPSLFIRGEKSNYILDNDFDLIHEQFPNTTIETVVGAGHWVHAEKPNELEKIISTFLDKT